MTARPVTAHEAPEVGPITTALPRLVLRERHRLTSRNKTIRLHIEYINES
jgi:hypothetical protein